MNCSIAARWASARRRGAERGSGPEKIPTGLKTAHEENDLRQKNFTHGKIGQGDENPRRDQGQERDRAVA